MAHQRPPRHCYSFSHPPRLLVFVETRTPSLGSSLRIRQVYQHSNIASWSFSNTCLLCLSFSAWIPKHKSTSAARRSLWRNHGSTLCQKTGILNLAPLLLTAIPIAPEAILVAESRATYLKAEFLTLPTIYARLVTMAASSNHAPLVASPA